ncbi:unnamed protein product [Parnassius apollo]|uniref:Lysosome-associated membrane glycoprotein 5 n=1 Tax=Parnassius apollo TaxID=110799 RepID=A0A8S3XZP1_PARAO|nr:unnamed protein product [Parnassius apollo]
MALLRLCVFLTVICSLIVIGQGVSITTKKPVLIPIPSWATSQNPPALIPVSNSDDTPVDVHGPLSMTTLESSEPDPTPAPSPVTTTSTAVPTTKHTTTPEPAPTTTVSTTTVPTTTTVTPTPEPKPTPAPGPLPPPSQGKWAYTDKTSNVTCILVQFAAQLNVTYPKNINGSTSLAYVLLNVPANATVSDGSCNATEQWIKLTWPESGDYSMLLVFTTNTTTKDYALHSLNATITPDILVNSSLKNPVELWHGVEWQVPLATSYRCSPATQLNMTAEITSMAATLTISQLQEEAFRNAKNSNTFSAARECGGGDLPDAVPIAVGCALGGLVVVVLIAYLEGRRRSAARGYLSM